MNSKRYYNQQVEKTSLRAIKNYSPDVIIAFDDNAQKLLSKYMGELDKNVKIIFAGVNGYVDKYNYNGKENITGVFERKPVAGAIAAINQFNALNNTPYNKSLFLLTDNNTSSKLDREILGQENWKDYKFASNSVSTFDEWKKFIKEINKDQVHYLLVSGYRKLRNSITSSGKNKYASTHIVAQWTQENSPVPVIALNSFAAGDGFSFSIGSSPAEQANVPLAMMDKILKQNIKPIDIPYKYPEYYSVAINTKAINNFKFEIPELFYSFAASANNIHE